MTHAEFIELMMLDGWEAHYAPLLHPGLTLIKGTEFKPFTTWPDWHDLYADFITHRNNGNLVMFKEITYGHMMFNGHSGRVQCYKWKEKD